jgi:rubredoxin
MQQKIYLARHQKPESISRVASPGTQGSGALSQGARIMSDGRRSSKNGDSALCPRCGTPMKDVVTIAPLAGEPGLVAYECPNCGYVTSIFLRPESTGGSAAD